ncbi:MAG: PAS domain S-box protein [Dehalococcoidales bacterium]|nr:PAS domain S-box protein [Dehalococcoidales bacterium]
MISSFYTFSVVLNLVSIVIIFSLAVFIWNRRPAPGVVPFTLFLLLVIIWVFVRSIIVATADIQMKVSLGYLMYFVTASTCIVWLFFALDYTGYRWWRRPRNIFLLFLMPLVTVLLLAINRQGVSEWLKIYPDIEATGTIVVWQRTLYIWIQAAFVGALLLTGSFLICRSAFAAGREQRWKAIVILISTLIPVVTHIISGVGYYPIKGLDFTPFALALAGIIYTTTIFHFRFLDIVPVARSTLFEKIPDGILVLDAEGNIADMNPSGEWLTGIKRDSVLGKKLDNVSPWLYQLISETGSGRHIEIIPDVTGSRFFLEASVTPLKDDNSTVTGWLIIIEDITYRKKATEAIKESEEKYRSLVNNIRLGVFRVTQQGKHLEINKAMENITGYSRDELLEMNASDLFLNVEDREAIFNQSLFAPERTAAEVWNRRKDGSSIMVAVTATPVRGQDGKLLYYDGILEDITERKKMTEQIRQLYEKERVQRQELEAEARARGIFINTLGHELRTPLTPIVVSAESLKELFNRDPASIESKLINNVYNGAEVLIQRLDELLELGKFAQGGITLNPRLLNPNTLVKQAISRCLPEIEGRNQKLSVEMNPDLPQLNADPLFLEQVFVNLLSNASKLSPGGGHIILRANATGDGLLVEVQDEGKGISAEEQERLFQPYHRVEQDRAKYQGLGLGLAISRQIVDAHKGRIWLTRLPDRGNTFSFFLPAGSAAE